MATKEWAACLNGITLAGYYPGGGMKECTLTQENRVETDCGTLIPQYEDDGVRRKFTHSLSFHPGGAVKSLSLQHSTPVTTPLGIIPAELVTFYESGRVRRVFPLNGKLSGFWSERSEYELAPELVLSLPFGEFRGKPIALHFYESGAIQSLTLWPGQKMTVPTAAGGIEARIGVSFFESGAVKTLEPLRPAELLTPAGILTAFDPDADGICGDQNSLGFGEDGSVAFLKAPYQRIRITSPDGTEHVHEPALCISHFSDDLYRAEPLDVAFFSGKVRLGAAQYDLAGTRFTVEPFESGRKTGSGCPGCGSVTLS